MYDSRIEFEHGLFKPKPPKKITDLIVDIFAAVLAADTLPNNIQLVTDKRNISVEAKYYQAHYSTACSFTINVSESSCLITIRKGAWYIVISDYTEMFWSKYRSRLAKIRNDYMNNKFKSNIDLDQVAEMLRSILEEIK